MNTVEITTPEKGLTSALSEQSRARRRKRHGLVALEAVASVPRRNDLLPPIKLEPRAIASLHAPARVLRKVRPEHVAEIAQSLAAFGAVAPILIAADGRIIDGVSTVQAAKTIGLGVLPCVVIDHLTPQELRLLRLALNRLGEKGRWDLDELKVEFHELLDFDLPVEVSGFTLPEIDIIMQDAAVVDDAANDVPAQDSNAPVVSQHGDLWQLGRHRLLCADATKPESYLRLFHGAPQARAVFTDPPYNIKIDGFAVGAGSIKHREFVAASGEMTDDEFDTFLADFLTAASVQLVDGGILHVCMDWRHAEHVQRAARRAALVHLNTVVWVKGNGGLGGLYRSAHEFVLVLRKGSGTSINNVELGKHGRDRTNVWTYPGANQRGSSAHAELANHPTPKPVELVADAMLDVTNRGDIVIDAFAGSIRGYHAMLDAKKLGYQVLAFVFVGLASQSDREVRAFEERAKSWTKVRECSALSGKTYFLLKCVARDLTELQAFVTETLLTTPNVETVKTAFVVRVSKDEPAVPIALVEAALPPSAPRKLQLPPLPRG